MDKQSRVGDFESNTIIGKNNVVSLGTIVDKKSLSLKMSILPDRTATSVSSCIKDMLMPIKDIVHTITFDNGKEFVNHVEISNNLDTKIFYADPYSF